MARIGNSSNGPSPLSVTSPLVENLGIVSIPKSDTNTSGYLSTADWNTFNNKVDASRFNYITNADAELDTAGWNLYNNAGRTTSATAIINDITFTSVSSGDTGNGVNIAYVFHPTQPSSAPLVTVLSPTHITVAWYNGPTLANNPTATQLKAAYDAVPAALAIATASITGTPGNLQYITGSHLLSGGGDTFPVNGTGGAVIGTTFTRTTVNPLIGTASFNLAKDAVSREGTGVSTDFIIDSLDKDQPLQISFAYQGSAGMTLGTSSDVQVFVYDITNAALIPVTPLRTIPGPTGAAKVYVGQFNASSTSVNYRLVLHIATANANAWNLLLDDVIVNDELNPVAATQVPSVVLQAQPISVAVTDHMAVAWADGATQWVPATSAFNGDYWSMLGFATNILGDTADIYVEGFMDGFSFGPFLGYNQYIDPAKPGGLTPLPAPFTDTYVIMGKAISATAMNIQPYKGKDLVTTKGGLLTNAGGNNGTGDQVLAVAANGNMLMANSAAALGLSWAAAIANGGGFTYTLATRVLAVALSGDVTGAATATAIAAATVTGKLITGFVSGAGTVAATDTILQAINKIVGNIALKSPIATPVFTGDVNSSTGNVLISTLGKGLNVKSGVNSKIGVATLVAGTATVANTSVTANSRIFLTAQSDGGTPGFHRITAKTVGTSFVITSSNPLDTSVIAWTIIESI